MHNLSLSEIALFLMVLFPLMGAALNGIGGRRESKRFVSAVAVGAVALSFLCALFSFGTLFYARMAGDPDARIVADLYEWFPVILQDDAVIDVRVRFIMDALSGVMGLFVTGIGLLIHIYSVGYMSEEPSYARFFSYLNLFMASMLILVLGSSLPVMFVGWEGVGLCSYLLIGFWSENRTYAAAGRKAFIANRIGDFGVIAGMLILMVGARSFEFSDINQSAQSLASLVTPVPWLEAIGIDGISVATLACLCLFLGCAGKSAQIPLYVWLPDAMAGPTPVSALIHAATMVTAGVYLTCRLSPLFTASPGAMAVVASVGAATALLGASIALVQNQLKKVLAYSTVSQLGFMFAGVGVGAFTAGFFHVFTHAFFKACLFLGAGSVMHSVGAHGDADIRHLGGLRKFMPITHATFLISCLAIAGIPPFSGFFSKDEILLGAAEAGTLFPFAPWLSTAVFFVLLTAATMTAFYMFRLYIMTFTGAYRGGESHGHDHTNADQQNVRHDEHASDAAHHATHDTDHDADHAAHHAPHESPTAMTAPLIALALGATVAGFLGMPHTLQEVFHIHNIWNPWLEPAVKNIEFHGAAHSFLGLPEDIVPWAAMALGMGAGIVGIFAAWFTYSVMQGRPAMRLAVLFPAIHQRILDKWRVDEMYSSLILRPLRKVAELSGVIDRVLVDGVLARLSAAIIRVLGYLTSRAQTGYVATYATAMALGIAALGWWFAYPHARFDYKAAGGNVTFQARQGLGYSERWDFNSDGEYDTPWKTTPNAISHEYAHSDARSALVRVELVEFQIETISEFRLKPGEEQLLAARLLKLAGPSQTLPPAIRFTRHGVMFRPNGAAWTKSGAAIRGQEIAWQYGETLELGAIRLKVLPEVCATLEVRGPLGLVGHTRKRIVLEAQSDPNADANKEARL